MSGSPIDVVNIHSLAHHAKHAFGLHHWTVTPLNAFELLLILPAYDCHATSPSVAVRSLSLGRQPSSPGWDHAVGLTRQHPRTPVRRAFLFTYHHHRLHRRHGGPAFECRRVSLQTSRHVCIHNIVNSQSPIAGVTSVWGPPYSSFTPTSHTASRHVISRQPATPLISLLSPSPAFFSSGRQPTSQGCQERLGNISVAITPSAVRPDHQFPRQAFAAAGWE